MSTPIEHEFPGDSSTPAQARSVASSSVAALLDGHPAEKLRDDAELVVSELVTNAVRAGGEKVFVSVGRIAGSPDRITIAVRDMAAGWPEPRVAGIHDTGGRGLALVSAVSSAWGVRLDSRGKTVWAELDIPGGETASDPGSGPHS